MPFYQFNCLSHGLFETYQGICEDHRELCPICKKMANRVFSAPIIMGDLPTLNRAKAVESEANMAVANG